MIRVLGIAFVLLLVVPLVAQGQQWSTEQQEVWEVVQESWNADNAEDITWIDRMVLPKLRGWDTSYPMPRDLETARRWNRYNDSTYDVLEFSIDPVAIIIEGNTAVAFCFGSIATEDLKGERETANFREVDVLVRVDGQWKFLAWMGADEPNQNG